ncbi:hypothetical protein DSLASN_32250 [Desulfoluna limicola]|uniref:Uncharacterized protein n=1 Tax=Desulfoluna limicola TaxID=2810562 RepID=A0ABM7PKJ2_9BACT|nr:hypothetical protein DSLASN_32250 [Desulfoluna limicola]
MHGGAWFFGGPSDGRGRSHGKSLFFDPVTGFRAAFGSPAEKEAWLKPRERLQGIVCLKGVSGMDVDITSGVNQQGLYQKDPGGP